MGKRRGVQKSREDILREKRERERERRKQIREDPVKRQEQREKERQKYLKQKQNKVKKSVEDMTPREKRQVRKKWKENSKKYRLRKKQTDMEMSLLKSNTPPASSDEENQPPNLNVSFQRQIGRKIANRNKIKRYREKKATARKMQDLKRMVELYKKKYYRLLGASQIEPSKVEEVKKNLMFGEVVQQHTYAEDCLLRKCNKCKDAIPHFKEFNDSDLLQYLQWIYLKQNYFDKKTKTVKQCRKIAKQPKEVRAAELVTILMEKLPTFLNHEGRILHQHHAIFELKKVLKANEIIIHCDFSENYSLKYAEEIQSFHFGGARQQVTLHTVVVYSKAGSDTVPKSYCTLSESLYHGPAAIWAHLNPIVKEYTQNDVDVIHFLSDSPATQYRNKQMFSFITNQFMEHFPKVKRISWNYHEAGHGKGAPDGIGGVCKRTADRVVAQGKDIPNFESLVNVLKEACPGIYFYVINSTDIETYSSIISKQKLLAFEGTLKVHQIVPIKKTLWFRSLSCFTCTDFCNHFHLGSLSYEDVSSESNTSSESDEGSEDIPLSNLLKNKSKLQFSDVYSDDEVPSCSYPCSKAKTGDYVLVSLESINKKLAIQYRYVAVCQSDFQDSEIKVAYLKLCDCQNGDLFKLGEENDVSYVQEDQILEVLPEPKLLIKGHRIYYKFPRSIDVFETA
nr:unnamed protein product [Callosobruchus chinensis]